MHPKFNAIHSAMEDLHRIIAKKLLQLKCFSVQVNNPFTWANRWKAPVYLDDRKILSYTYARSFVKLELARLIAERYPDVDVIAGIATTAIAHGVLAAEQLGLPFVYVHPSPKKYGLENQIEGDLRPRQKVVIVENKVIVGDNAARVIEAIRNNGCTVLGVVTVFDYEFQSAKKAMADAGVELLSLTNATTTFRVAKEEHITSDEILAELAAWHKNPTKWKK